MEDWIDNLIDNAGWFPPVLLNTTGLIWLNFSDYDYQIKRISHYILNRPNMFSIYPTNIFSSISREPKEKGII